MEAGTPMRSLRPQREKTAACSGGHVVHDVWKTLGGGRLLGLRLLKERTLPRLFSAGTLILGAAVGCYVGPPG
ncbi:hypothetical protein EYF80_044952 [Liparis tanakae]|uniref:Uncharacterized protein n=1 Tax=Liparis tanakae TaxID=230148 RepID=A0A4Z2FVM4_9TELE|nr:hypothetical protein EYF80_044952 [Liparis tanakae]